MQQIILGRFPNKTGRTQELLTISEQTLNTWRQLKSRDDVRTISEQYILPMHKIHRVFYEGKACQEVVTALTEYFNSKQNDRH
jgi:hypothetical protein